MELAKQYGLWLSFNNQEEGFEIPILPPAFDESTSGDGAGMDVLGLGKINVIKNRNLSEYSINSFFPAQRYPFVNASVILEPPIYVELIKKWWSTNRPIRLVYIGKGVEINQAVSIESFTFGDAAGASGDINYSLNLKEYKFYSAKLVKPLNNQTNPNNPVTQLVKSAESRGNEKITPKTYTIKSGDTLTSIAKLQLNDSTKWKMLQNINNITDAEVKSLKVGRVLKLA